MDIQVFINNDALFLQWLSKNPNGFFINTYRNPSINYMVLHKSGCRDFSTTNKIENNKFTGNQYIKICSNDTNNLIKFINSYGGNDFSKVCKHCHPQLTIDRNFNLNSQQDYEEIFQLQIMIAKNNPLKKSGIKVENKPEKIEVTTYIYRRDPSVVIAALERANGICEHCYKSAPFMRITDGTPYLEVHHINPLSNGGADSISNVKALCPNCHRYYHYGVTRYV